VVTCVFRGYLGDFEFAKKLFWYIILELLVCKGFTMSQWNYLDLLQHVRKLWRYLSSLKFKRVFGKDSGKEYHLIYNICIPPEGIVFSKPEPKFKRKYYRRTKSLTTINSCATTRAIGYLVYAFGEKDIKPPTISSDEDNDTKMDFSFISIGGVTNLKSCDVLENKSNHFLVFRCCRDKEKSTRYFIVSKSSGLPIVEFNKEFDYGFIIKIYPDNNPGRTWICCAGFGEWGASGAAWYLSRKWKDIHRRAKNKSFAIITKTKFNSDESTVSIHTFRTSEEVEKVARELKITTNTTTVITKTETKQTTVTALPEPMPSPEPLQ